MQVVTIDCKWDKEIILGDSFLDYIKKNKIKSVAMFASVQFMEVATVRKQLEDLGVKIHITKAKRTNAPMQILGCDAYHNSFDEDIIGTSDAIVYIGDGYFHPKALLLSQIYENKAFKPVVIWNPVLQKTEIIGVEDIQKQVSTTKANLLKYVHAKTIGILVTAKPGQQYLPNAKRLKKKLEAEGKKAYIFIDDDIQINLFENYPFIDAWVNTACPRIGTDDHVNISQPLINLREANNPLAALEKLPK